MNKDTKTSAVKSGGALVLAATDSFSTFAVRIVGATLSSDMRSLLKVLKETKEKDDKASFCALSGIFYVLTNKEESLKNLLQINDHEDPYEKIAVFIDLFEKILIKDSWGQYPIAAMPDLKIDKEQFWLTVWEKFFSLILSSVFDTYYRKESLFDRFNQVGKVLFIASQYGLFDKNIFFKNHVKKVIWNELDSKYGNTFSNSINTIWRSERVGWDYFFQKTILFNPSIPPEIQKLAWKRWQAWFLLEDHYRQTRKKVKRANLIAEMEQSLKLL